jgi:hypothetical protein
MSPAKKLQVLKQDEFDQLLSWLDPDPETAGLIYEKIRRRLITILASRRCAVPEEMADETIDRVARRVADIRENYVSEKAIYFLGVMNNVHHEYLKRAEAPQLSIVSNDDAVDKETVHVCLDKCLSKLAPHANHLIERYYAENKRARIDLRKGLASELGISLNTLRLRALRIREKLQTCIETCLLSEARPLGRAQLL